MKSVLVIDTPNKCANCPLGQENDMLCRASIGGRYDIEEDIKFGTRFVKCPLKAIPEYKVINMKNLDSYRKVADLGVALGYDLCIDEIIGEEQ